jgi:hypothetical protein
MQGVGYGHFEDVTAVPGIPFLDSYVVAFVLTRLVLGFRKPVYSLDVFGTRFSG